MKRLGSEAGLITVDFLFALVLILGFTSLMFVLSFSLSVASLTQYITFAAARNYAVAHLDRAAQEQRAQLKYRELIENPVFTALYSNGWYQIDAQPNIGDHTQTNPEFQDATSGVNLFWGVGTTFVARVLDFRIPFFGSTAPDSDGSGSGFKTYLGSYLGREPTTQECLDFVAARWDAIRRLSGSGASYSSGTGGSRYYAMTDNGC
ncbi:MAG: hypothetical protein AB7G93_19665 [Bdellovibrionales bacterium]